MKSITVVATLNAPARVVWAAVQRPELYLHIVGSMLRYPAAERHEGPWQVGTRIVGWTFLVRLIPLSRHTIEIAEVDHDAMTLRSEESDGLVRSWRHFIAVDALGEDRCRYEDRIDMDAGVLTPMVAAFAWVFYRYRQRRWRRLAPLLAAATQPLP